MTMTSPLEVEICKNQEHTPDPSTTEIVTKEYCLIRCKVCGLTAEVMLKWRGNYA